MKKPNKSSSWIEQIHLEKYEILFNAYSRFTLVSGWRVMVKYHDIFRGRLCSPALKQNSAAHLKTNFQVIPSIETNEKNPACSSWIEQFIWKYIYIYMHEIFLKAYIYIRAGFSIGLGMASHWSYTNDIFRGRPCSPAQNKTQPSKNELPISSH